MMMTMNNSYKMHDDPGLTKSHPYNLRGNRILICVSGGGAISKFEGMVDCTCQEYVIMILL
jgi:hypothetical protein